MATPTARASEGLKLDATAMDDGNCVTPVWELATPTGPSVKVNAGMHREGTATLVFSTWFLTSSTTKFAFCVSVIRATTSRASVPGLAVWCSDAPTHGQRDTAVA